MLCESIGARATGSQANLTAVEYAYRAFEKYGLCVQCQSFACMDWTYNGCSLVVCRKELSVLPAPYSLACDVQGEIICVNSLDELRCAQITDKFVLFNGEDYYSNPGEMTYLTSHLSHPEEFVCAYNIDGVGLKDQNLSYSFYECPEKLINNITNFAANFSILEKIEPWPQGDHMLFASSGIPAISITS